MRDIAKGLHGAEGPHASGMGGFRSPQAGKIWVPYLCGMGSHGHLLPLPL